jgi:hypothetical protein
MAAKANAAHHVKALRILALRYLVLPTYALLAVAVRFSRGRTRIAQRNAATPARGIGFVALRA